jgi:hypothetical protein
MRDYKNVKVPKSFRSEARSKNTRRTSVKRVTVNSGKKHGDLTGTLIRGMYLALAVGVIVLAWQAYQSVVRADFFTVAGVDISGVKHLDRTELQQFADPFKGKNIFRLDVDSVMRRARMNPWIREARIYRKLPNRVAIAIEERTPAMIVESGKKRWIADDEGWIIESAGTGTVVQQYPTVVVGDVATRLGQQIATEGMLEARELLAAISARGGWRPEDINVRAFSPESLSVTYQGCDFKFGSDRYADKLVRLSDVLKDLRERNLDPMSLDLRPERQAAALIRSAKAKDTGSKGKKRGA